MLGNEKLSPNLPDCLPVASYTDKLRQEKRKIIYRYCTPAGFDIPLNLRLRASRIDELNDPFELAFGIQTETARADVKKDFEESLELLTQWEVILKEQNISFKEDSIEDLIEKVVDFQISDLRRVVKLLQDQWKETHGVSCFSKFPDIIQMWAHYADNHKGLVIGLDEKVLTSNPEEELAIIKYDNDFIRIPVFANPNNIALYAPYITETFKRKEEKWGYEKEVRVYINLEEKSLDGRFYRNIPAEAVKEIYLGLQTDETTEIIAKEIANREKYKHLNVFKMNVHPDEYKLVPEPIWP